MAVKISALPAMSTPLAGTETIPGVKGGVTQSTTVDDFSTYTLTQLVAASDSVTSNSGDDILIVRSGGELATDIDVLSAYAYARAWTDATVRTSSNAGDLLLFKRGAAIEQIDVDDLTTYVLTTVQADVLDISGLGSATLDATDLFLVGEGASPKIATLTELETKLYADRLTYMNTAGTAPPVTLPLDADKIYCLQGGVEKTVSAAVLATYVETENGQDVLESAWSWAPTGLPLADADTLIFYDDSAVAYKTCTILNVQDRVVAGYLNGLGTASAASTDKFYCNRSGSDRTALGSTINTMVWDDIYGSTAATSMTTADLFAFETSGGLHRTITMANAAGALRDTLLDISGLASGTISDSDYILVCETSTPKQVLWSAIQADIDVDYKARVAALTVMATDALADADIFYMQLAAGTERKITAVLLSDYVRDTDGANIIEDAFDAADVGGMTTGDLFLAERSTTRYRATVDNVSAYVIDDLIASPVITTTLSGDNFIFARGTDEKIIDVDNLCEYTSDIQFDATVSPVVTPVGTDHVAIGRGTGVGASKKALVSALATLILTGYRAEDLDSSLFGSAGGLNTTDLMYFSQSGTTGTATLGTLETQLWGDFGTHATGVTSAGTLAGTEVLYIPHPVTPKQTTGLAVAIYTAGALWTSDCATIGAIAAQAGDEFLMRRGGTTYVTDINELQTYMVSSIQATALDVSTLSAVLNTAIDGSDYVYIHDGAAKKMTVTEFSQQVFEYTDTYITSDLSAITLPADADLFLLSQGGALKTVTGALLHDNYLWEETQTSLAALSAKTAPVAADSVYIEDSENAQALKRLTLTNLWENYFASQSTSPWRTVTDSYYTDTPASTSTLTMSNTGDFEVGFPVRYTIAAVTYYGVVTAVAANSLLTIAGAPLSGDVTLLEVGRPSQVKQVELYIPGNYNASSGSKLASVGLKYFRWAAADGYLVTFSAVHASDDAATNPDVNVSVAGSEVSTVGASDDGPTIAAAGTWVNNTAVEIAPANYAIVRNDALEVVVTNNGTGDADDLTVSCTFILES